MQTEAFILYKDRMIEYLRDFIKDLQRFSAAIEEFLRHLDSSLMEGIIGKIVEYEVGIPRMDRVLLPEELQGEIQSRWDNLSGWFLGYRGDESEALRLLNATNEIIRKITRFAARIAENRSRALNRKQDYLKLAAAFAKFSDVEAAHILSSSAVGAFNTRHLVGDFERATESVNSGVWEETPQQFTIKPKVRNYSEGNATGALRDHSEARAERLQEYLKTLEEEQTIIDYLIRSKRIVLADLPEVEPFVRTILLRWISKAMATRQCIGQTEDGRVYRVLFPKNGERIWLRCSDGNINMPALTIEFREVV